MKWCWLVLVFVSLVVSCDIYDSDHYGLSLDIVNEPQISWRIENITRGEVVFDRLDTNGENIFLSACKYRDDECEVKLVAEPLIAPPDGCSKWRLQHEDFRIRHNRRHHRQWHLREPRAFDCEERDDDKN